MADGEQRTPTSVGGGPRYGILGGTFDPPHIAHLIIAQEALAQLNLDQVYFVPTGQPPHKGGRVISSAADRSAMVERAIAGNARFALSMVEIEREGPSYTAETLRRLRAAWGSQVALDVIIGWDMLLDLPDWYDPSGVVAEAAHVVAVHRPGYDPDPRQIERVRLALPELPAKLIVLPVPPLAISASELRRRVASSLPIRYYVPDTVAEYIASRGLYRHAEEAQSVARQDAAYSESPQAFQDERVRYGEGSP
jgi:nicotinate-nucleotide adenylyltransferase